VVREHSRGEQVGTVGGDQLLNLGSAWAAAWPFSSRTTRCPSRGALIGRGLPHVHPGPGPDEGQVVLQQRVSSMVRPGGHPVLRHQDHRPVILRRSNRSAVVLEIYAREHAPLVGHAVTRLGV